MAVGNTLPLQPRRKVKLDANWPIPPQISAQPAFPIERPRQCAVAGFI
jgi:hypothetical protein